MICGLLRQMYYCHSDIGDWFSVLTWKHAPILRLWHAVPRRLLPWQPSVAKMMGIQWRPRLFLPLCLKRDTAPSGISLVHLNIHMGRNKSPNGWCLPHIPLVKDQPKPLVSWRGQHHMEEYAQPTMTHGLKVIQRNNKICMDNILPFINERWTDLKTK